jgi:hypothetical protein
MTFLFDGLGVLAAALWIKLALPLIARWWGIPFRAAFWQEDVYELKLSRWQFVVFYGVAMFGVGGFLLSVPDELRTVVLYKGWVARLQVVGFSLAFPTFFGIAIAYYCAPTAEDKSPVTELGLSRKE